MYRETVSEENGAATTSKTGSRTRKGILEMTLKWDRDSAEFNRGMDLGASTSSALDDLQSPMTETWNKVVEIANGFKEDGKLHVLSEVWPDTGRVIFILSDQREFARIILSIQRLEERYYELASLDEDEFERQYPILVDSILSELLSCISSEDCTRLGYDIEVVGRATDDKDMQRQLFTFTG